MVTAAPVRRALIAPPTGFALWASVVVKALVAGQPPLQMRRIGRADALTEAADQPVIYVSTYPSRGLIEAIAQGEVAALYVVEDAVDSAAYLMTSASCKLREALRTLSAATTANLAIGNAAASRLMMPNGDTPALQIVAEMAAILGLPGDATSLNRALAAASPKCAPTATLDEAVLARVTGHVRRGGGAALIASDGDRAIVANALYPLLDLAHGPHQRQAITWPTEMFLDGDNPGSTAPQVASAVGPSRVIYYGPYLHLPPALYGVEVVAWFGPEIADLPFIVNVQCGKTTLAKVRLPQRPGGTYAGAFEFRHDNPADPIEMQVCSELGSIEGRLSLREVRMQVLRPVGEVPAASTAPVAPAASPPSEQPLAAGR